MCLGVCPWCLGGEGSLKPTSFSCHPSLDLRQSLDSPQVLLPRGVGPESIPLPKVSTSHTQGWLLAYGSWLTGLILLS